MGTKRCYQIIPLLFLQLDQKIFHVTMIFPPFADHRVEARFSQYTFDGLFYHLLQDTHTLHLRSDPMTHQPRFQADMTRVREQKPRATGPNLLNKREKVLKRPAQPVILRHNDHIARPQLIEHPFQFRPGSLRAGDLLGPDALGTGRRERTYLSIEISIFS